MLRFNAHEMASRLSYALWGSMPDDQLFAQADANKLGSAADIETQVRRMLADPKAAQAMEDFHLQWLEVDSLAKAPKEASFKDYTPAAGAGDADRDRRLHPRPDVQPEAGQADASC